MVGVGVVQEEEEPPAEEEEVDAAIPTLRWLNSGDDTSADDRCGLSEKRHSTLFLHAHIESAR